MNREARQEVTAWYRRVQRNIRYIIVAIFCLSFLGAAIGWLAELTR